MSSSVLAVDWPHELLQLVGMRDQFSELMILADVIDGPVKVLELLGVNHQLLEVVVTIDVVNRALKMIGKS